MEQATAMEYRERALPAKRFGARTRSGDQCRKSAAGVRRTLAVASSLHEGCTPDHVKHAARQEATEFVVGVLGHEMDIDPLACRSSCCAEGCASKAKRGRSSGC